jgi:UDP-glucose 4-epimerase
VARLKIFISGVAGLVGSALAREAVALGWQVAGADNLLGGDELNVPREGVTWWRADCRDVRQYFHLLKDADVVYHCAAAPYEGLSVFSPQLVADHTFLSTVGLLRAAIQAGVKRFVFCSSMSRYGHQPQTPFTEDMTPAPADPYAICKVAAEDLVRNLCGLHGMEYVICVPHNVMGPGQRYWDPYRNVAAIMINRILQGKPPIVYGDGSQRRSLTCIDDVTGPLLKLATEDVAGEVFNVGPDDPGITILELAQMILKLCDSDMEPVHFPARPAEVHTATCSAAKARRVLGYEPEWGLEDGLRAMIAWVRERGPRPFDYHLPLEITASPLAPPATWADRLM